MDRGGEGGDHDGTKPDAHSRLREESEDRYALSFWATDESESRHLEAIANSLTTG